METYVVKEIREYEESILMGLNKRQLLCSVLAILSAVSGEVRDPVHPLRDPHAQVSRLPPLQPIRRGPEHGQQV